MSDDAQIDGGDRGQAMEDRASNLIGDVDNAGAVRWYGLYCFWLGGGAVAFWILMNNNAWVVKYSKGIHTRMYFYLPTGLAWIMVSMFDGALMREIYKDIVALSIMAPFWMEWYDYGLYLLLLEYDDTLGYLVGLALWLLLTVFEGVIQLLLLP